VYVLRQDGTIAKAVDSVELLPVKIVDEHDFYVNSFVAAKDDTSDGEGTAHMPS